MNDTYKQTTKQKVGQSFTQRISHKTRILSWNIQDSKDQSTGSKLIDEDFINTITQGEIFCLQETKGELKVPGFKCYNSLRTGSRSGGLCIGVKHEIGPLVTTLKTKTFSRDIQAVKLSRKLT